MAMIRNTVRIFTVLCALSLFAGVSLAQAGADQNGAQGATSGSKKSKKGASSDSHRAGKKTDVNSASKEELIGAGLDDASAQKIVDGRPYKTKRDLVTKNILTGDQYDKVKDQLVAHGGKSGTGKKAGKKGADAGGDSSKK
jgi:DNA uptake protein ComE-like DNA-binding protein